jgi:hypothetical protein
VSTLHYISIRKLDGCVVARRKGGRQVVVSRPGGWLRVDRPEGDDRALPHSFELRFVSDRQNSRGLLYKVLEARIGPECLSIEDFQARYAVSDEELGRWARASVERSLDEDGQKDG